MNFIFFCFAFATENTASPDLFWQWVRQNIIFTPEQKNILLALREDGAGIHSLDFVDLSSSLTVYSVLRDALRTVGSDPGQFINHTLTWSDTVEGHTFWSRINSRFATCWDCIRRANASPISTELGLMDLRSALMANISARMIGRNELMNDFFFDYEHMRLERRQARERQLREEMRQAREAVEREAQERPEVVDNATLTDVQPISQEELERIFSEMQHGSWVHYTQVEPSGLSGSTAESIQAQPTTMASNTATIASQGTTAEEPRNHRVRVSFLDPFYGGPVFAEDVDTH